MISSVQCTLPKTIHYLKKERKLLSILLPQTEKLSRQQLSELENFISQPTCDLILGNRTKDDFSVFDSHTNEEIGYNLHFNLTPNVLRLEFLNVIS